MSVCNRSGGLERMASGEIDTKQALRSHQMSNAFSLKDWGLCNLVLSAGDVLLGHPMMKRRRRLEQMQWWPRERIERERDQTLAKLIATSHSEVPFYRDLFAKASVTPEEIRSPEDLRRLPVVTKPMLREAYPDKCCRTVRQRTYEASTSGSTGKNFRVREDHETAGWYRASFLLALGWAGWRIGEPHVQVGMTTQRNLERRLKDRLLGCYYVPGFNLTDPALDRCLELMDGKRIRHLWGYPGSLFCLARRAQQRGWNTPLKSVVTWGDQLHAHFRETMERAFGVRVCDTYGCGEGMQIAAQCGHGSHYHVHELDVIVEYLDEKDHPVPAGTPGRIVLTRLHAGPMPFIRYDVGDVGIEGTETSCACGRSLRLLQSIQGRNADYVLTPAGNRLIVHFFTGILEYFREIDSFQVIQTSVEGIRIHIVPGPGYGHDTPRKVQDALRQRGAHLDIDIQAVKEIPLTPGGKRRFIVRTCGGETPPLSPELPLSP